MGHASLSDAELSRRRKILTGILVVAVLVVVGGVLWSLRGPSDRGAIEGEVTLDKVPLEKGRITFTPTDGTPGPTVTVKIENGRYKVSASEGPAIGINRIQIHGDQETGKQVPKMGGLSGEMIDEVIELVAKKWNYESKEKIEIKPGANTKDFAVTRK